MIEITSIPVHRLADRIAQRQLSPVEVVDAFLDRATRLSPKLNAFTAVYATEARAAARDAQCAIEAGSAVGPLHGVPIALKDSIDVEGKPTTAGSACFQNRIARRSAKIVDHLRAAGAIIIGKTQMVEFGLGALGLNETYGTPWNPWRTDTHHAPGGSSSGAAVAVAARIAPCALGTDTGGSARIPAAWCGVTGMKPTRRHFDMDGIVPLSPTLDVVGPICRTAEELAWLFHALICHSDVSDAPLASLLPSRPDGEQIRDAARYSLYGYRLGFLAADLEDVDAPILTNYHAALNTFTSLGASLVPLELPRSFPEYRTRTSAITFYEAHALYGGLAWDPASKLDTGVKQRLRHAVRYSSQDYTTALTLRTQLQQECAPIFVRVNALLTPTTQNLPPRISDAERFDPPNAFTRFVNLLDLCAVSVPSGWTNDGLPTGLQIVCKTGDDATALKVAIAYQHITMWHARVPPL
jgi:aspartyl-tRNA(Asn)/glutamyl-tRNA(Gln) amidotransferase subunit A